MENKPDYEANESSLEVTETTIADGDPKPIEPKKPRTGTKIRGLVTSVNVYLLLFIFILVFAGMLVFIGAQRAQNELAQPALTTTPLDQATFEKLTGSESSVGDPKQTLSVESNTVFTGKVLLRDNLDVAGSLKVGGELSLPGITVAGTSNLDQITANQLSINGDASIQGALVVQRNLTVTGSTTFGGPISAPQISTPNLQITGDLVVVRHIDAGGGTPGKTNGTALGAGGTSSLSGTDTAGTLTINTGGGPAAGCFATINFAVAFNGAPHVAITPIGSAAAGINYYVNRNSTSMSICTASAPPAGANFSFDYIVID